MVDKVTFRVPFPKGESGHRKVHQESSHAPAVGEVVTAATKPDGYLGKHIVVEREWRVEEEGYRDRQETKIRVICRLERVDE